MSLLEDVAARSLEPTEVETKSLELARQLFALASELRDSEEEARRRRLARLLQDEKGQLFTTLLTDRVARDKDLQHASADLEFLLEHLGAPHFMSPLERAQLELGAKLGKVIPKTVSRLVLRRIRSEVKGLVFPCEEAKLRAFLAKRRAEGVLVNVNQLGEEVLGEAAAAERLEQYEALLRQPEIETISVKLSSIFSQIDLFAWHESRALLAERLRRIYRAAKVSGGSASKPGPSAARESREHKLVYLDMEAYRDLHFTVELVQELLDEPEFLDLTAGLVLQAYIPDSAALQRELIQWSMTRQRRGGAPLRLRIVKGANLAAERVSSSRMRWALPTFSSKHEVDANYKQMLYQGTEPAHAAAVRLGIASHNLFDLALGLVLRASRGVERYVSFEMLEGMANSERRALSLLGAEVLVYAPVVRQGEMDSAVAYLIRRLDENTASDNYLRHAFSMQLGDPEYEAQAEAFRRAHQARQQVSEKPRRPLDRFDTVTDLDSGLPFDNEPDTDFSRAPNRQRVTVALATLAERETFELCSVIDGKQRESRDVEAGFDPSRPGVVPYRYHLAAPELLDEAVSVAERGLGALAATAPRARHELSRKVAWELRRRRAELIAAMVLDAGKRAIEADAEVSEAIDFAEYYWRQSERSSSDLELRVRPKGVVAVISPWNFPLAIPLSGILAALLGGNSVIFKPASETAFVGERLASLLWAAGVPAHALQFVLCRDEVGSRLLKNPKLKAVVLTGATSTARLFLEESPSLELHAETGGKNAMIITARADRELAIRDLVASAFGYAGQKCSAASLAIVERSVYDDPHFLSQLRDATASLSVGSAWNAASVVTPLIRPPGPALARGLTELEPGESWLLAPRSDPGNQSLWSPGLKLGVKVGTFSQQTELFGPVLGLIRADGLDHAISIANGTAYGLTCGLHSLDEREQARFILRTECGNLYVNRTTTGAIVGRQPFGGHKASSVGPGAKAGGPNYVAELLELDDAGRELESHSDATADAALRSLPAIASLLSWAERGGLAARDFQHLTSRLANYSEWLEREFRLEHPAPEVLGQDNLFRYRACSKLLAVFGSEGSVLDLCTVAGAALLSGNVLHLSFTPDLDADLSDALPGLASACQLPIHREAAPELAARLPSAGYERIRWLGGGTPPLAVLRAAGALGCHLSTRQVLAHGRYELLFYHREQSVSIDYQRYGHLGWRSAGLRPPRPE